MMWNNVKLKDICKVFGDGNWIESKDQSNDGIRLIQTGNIKFGTFADRKNKARYVSEKTFKRLNCKEIFAGDILVSRLPDPVGRSCIIPKLSERAITAVDCTIIRLNEICLPEYLNYFMQSSQYFIGIRKEISGATRQRISRKNLGEILIPLPPLAEQQRLIAKLDAAFAEIDKSIVTTEKNINNSKKLFLNNLDNLVNEPNLGKKILLREVCTLSQGLAINKGTKHLLVAKSTKPLIRIKDLISNTVQKYIDNKYENKKTSVNKEDLIFTRTGSLGLVFRGREGVLHNNSFKVEPKNILSKDYMYWWLQNSSFLKKIHSLAGKAAQPDISHKLFSSQYIIVPTLQKQKEILEKVEKCMLDTKTLTELYKNKLKNFIQLKQSILKQELNGEFKKTS